MERRIDVERSWLTMVRSWLTPIIVTGCLAILVAGFFSDDFENFSQHWKMIVAGCLLVMVGILWPLSKMASSILLIIILALLASNVLLLWPDIISHRVTIGFGDTGISTPSLRWPYVFVALVHGFVYFYHLGKED